MRKMMLASMLGLGLGVVPACSLTGWGADDQVAPRFSATGSGSGHRTLAASQLGFFTADGRINSYTASTGKYNHEKGRVVGDPGYYTDEIRALQLFLDPSDHGGFDLGYGSGGGVVGAAHKPENHSDAKHSGYSVLTHVTRDTNKDGYVSGDDAECGMNSGVAFFGAGIPASAFFLDQSTCVKGQNVGNFSCGTTQGASAGARWFTKSDDFQEDAYETHSLWKNLPFSTRVDIMNSVNTQSDIKAGQHGEIVSLSLTQIRIGNQTYSPKGATANVVGMGNATVDPRNSGIRMTAAWVADRLQEALNQGLTKVDGSITINGAVTVSIDQLLSGVVVTKINQKLVDGLRQFAAGANAGQNVNTH